MTVGSGIKSTLVLVLLSFLVTLSVSTSFADARSIKSKSLEFASDYFAYPTAMELLSGQKIDAALKQTGRNDFQFLGEGTQGPVTQSAYLSLKPQFMMITVSRSAGSGQLMGVSVTRIDNDVPFSDIKYQAFDSSSSGSGKNKAMIFFMGDGSSGGVSVRHLIQETGQYTGGNYSQVSWLYTLKN